MSKILVCTNPFSEAERIVPYAIHVGKHLGFSLKFLHVVDTREYVWYSSYADSHSFSGHMEQDELLEKERKIKHDQLQELIVKHGSLIGVQPQIFNEVKIDMLEDVLYDYTRDPDTAFLLITDLSGPGNKAYNLLTAIESSHCPVWIVPPEGVYAEVNKILYASDFSEYDKKIIKSIKGLTRSYNAEIIVSGIDTSLQGKSTGSAPFYGKVMKELKSNNGVVVDDKNVSNTYDDISEYAAHIGADLVIIHHRESNLLRELSWSNSIEKVIRKNHPPVLVYKNSDTSN